MLTSLVAWLPPRVGHFLARVLGLEEVHALFCPHCPETDFWKEDV